jgi:hypothetical protein
VKGDVCYDTSYCVYSRLFKFIEKASAPRSKPALPYLQPKA